MKIGKAFSFLSDAARLGSLQAFGIASQEEAEAGEISTKLMTPQRVAQAIAALASGGGSAEGHVYKASGDGSSADGTYGAWSVEHDLTFTAVQRGRIRYYLGSGTYESGPGWRSGSTAGDALAIDRFIAPATDYYLAALHAEILLNYSLSTPQVPIIRLGLRVNGGLEFIEQNEKSAPNYAQDAGNSLALTVVRMVRMLEGDVARPFYATGWPAGLPLSFNFHLARLSVDLGGFESGSPEVGGEEL